MRVIGGKYKSRPLSPFKASHIRPMTDRVKESLFNSLQSCLEGAQVLDLFAGTGSLSIESLSRGAKSVQCVDSHPRSMEIIKRNKKLLDMGPELSIICLDVFEFLKKSQDVFDLILVDPPFKKRMSHEVLLALDSSRCLHPETQVFIEHSSQENLQTSYGSLIQKSVKKYGDKLLCRYIVGSQ